MALLIGMMDEGGAGVVWLTRQSLVGVMLRWIVKALLLWMTGPFCQVLVSWPSLLALRA